MAQEYYSFMMNRFFETLFIQLMANVYYIFTTYFIEKYCIRIYYVYVVTLVK